MFFETGLQMRIIVVGDVHGCIDQLHSLMNRVGPAEGDRIVLLGDFVDRGPDSPACVEFAREHESLMGNHEYKHVRHRYGVLKKLDESQLGTVEQFRLFGKDYEAAVDFMETLHFFIELPEVILVHAGLEYGIPMEKQNKIVLIGGLSQRRVCGIDPKTGIPFWCSRYPKNARPVIYGHLKNKVETIPHRENLFPIDTGCCRGGMLTAVTIPDFKIYQVPGWNRNQK